MRCVWIRRLSVLGMFGVGVEQARQRCEFNILPARRQSP